MVFSVPAFNAGPGGATSSRPRASERSGRHPGFGAKGYDTPPEGAKAVAEAIVSGFLNAIVGMFERSCRCFCPLRGRIGTHLA